MPPRPRKQGVRWTPGPRSLAALAKGASPGHAGIARRPTRIAVAAVLLVSAPLASAAGTPLMGDRAQPMLVLRQSVFGAIPVLVGAVEAVLCRQRDE